MFNVKSGNRFQLATITYFILGNILFGLIVSLFTDNLPILINALVSQLLFVAATVMVYKFFKKASWRHDFYIKPLPWLDVLIAVCIGWSLMPLLSFINVLSQFFVSNQIQDTLMDIVNLPFFVTVVLTGLFPAVFEELLSRATILRNYQKKTVWVTCLMSGMFFGFIHLNINQFLYAFAMGSIMSYLVMVTGSIVSSMVVHFTINVTSTGFLYISMAFMDLMEGNEALVGDLMSTAQPTFAQLAMTSVVMLFVALLFTPITILLLHLSLKRHNKGFKGSLRLYTEDFMASGVEVSTPDFNIHLEEASQLSHMPIHEEEKVWTPALLITAFLFISFSILVEFMTST